MDSSEGDVVVQNRADSSLVVEVMGKKYGDPFIGEIEGRNSQSQNITFALRVNNCTLRYQG